MLTYQWTQIGGPAVELEDPTSVSPFFISPNVEEVTVLTFELKLKDGTQDLGPFSPANSESDPDTVQITVNP